MVVLIVLIVFICLEETIKLESQKIIKCENNDLCVVLMSSEDAKI